MKINENASLKVPTKILIPAAAFILGAVFFYIGAFEYGFWSTETARPTKGFFPIIIAVALMGLSILAIVQALMKKDIFVEFKLANWLVPFALLCIIACSYITGLVIAVIIFTIVWLKVYEKQSWKTTLIALAVILFIVDGCFQFWLGIEMPKGLILENFTSIKFIRNFL